MPLARGPDAEIPDARCLQELTAPAGRRVDGLRAERSPGASAGADAEKRAAHEAEAAPRPRGDLSRDGLRFRARGGARAQAKGPSPAPSGARSDGSRGARAPCRSSGRDRPSDPGQRRFAPDAGAGGDPRRGASVRSATGSETDHSTRSAPPPPASLPSRSGGARVCAASRVLHSRAGRSGTLRRRGPRPERGPSRRRGRRRARPHPSEGGGRTVAILPMGGSFGRPPTLPSASCSRRRSTPSRSGRSSAPRTTPR
jgi:hypothetical protein